MRKYFTLEEKLQSQREKGKRFYWKHRAKILKECKEKKKLYYEKNKSKIIEKNKNYHEKNKPKIKVRRKKHYQKNKVKISNDRKEYYKINKHNIVKRVMKYEKNRMKIDTNYKLRKRLKGRVRAALKGNYKSGTTIKTLGCSIPELKLHLESKFVNGMTWENYGQFGWHIDHIIPCSSFDLTNCEEQLKCFNYTNLQPLWAKDNMKKSDNII